MLYVFADETYPTGHQGRAVEVAAVAATQREFSAKEDRVREVLTGSRRRGRQEGAIELLENLGAIAVVGWSSVDPDLLGHKVRDVFPDIEDVSRRDGVWTFLFAHAVALVLRRVVEAGEVFATVDLYHDPKSLTDRHYEATRSLMRNAIGAHLTAMRASRAGDRGRQVRLRRIQEVSKAPRGSDPTKLQLGTLWAHWILASQRAGEEAEQARLERVDFTAAINEYLHAS